MPQLEPCLMVFSVKDWADLLHSVAWPIVVLILGFSFRSVIESLLERLIQAEGFGVKMSFKKLDKEIPRAELEAKGLELKAPPSETQPLK